MSIRLGIAMTTVLKLAWYLHCSSFLSNKHFGYYPFGRDPRVIRELAWDPDSVTNDCPKIEGYEHTRYFRGNSIVDMNYFGAPTSKTPDGK